MWEQVHVIRVTLPDVVVSFITKPTTLPRKLFEVDAAARFPGAVLKSSRSYDPKSFAQIKREADLRGIAVDQVIDERESLVSISRNRGQP